MNADRTMETMGVVTPNAAIARRSQTTSYTRLQKPEVRKKPKYHRIFTVDSPDKNKSRERSARPTHLPLAFGATSMSRARIGRLAPRRCTPQSDGLPPLLYHILRRSEGRRATWM